MRVGIMGGTFDPVHLGHLLVAEEVRVQLGLERVIFLPAGQPWLRRHEPLSPAVDRMNMVELAVAGHPNFEACSSEIERGGPTYTVDTLEVLADLLGKDACLFFILGSDALADFPRWKDPDRILELCSLAVVSRPGCDEFDRREWAARFPQASGKAVPMVTPLIGISGTEIRRRAAGGGSLRYMVPDAVADYIRDHGLYLSC